MNKLFKCNYEPNIWFDEAKRYSRMITIDLPENKERQRRIKDGLNPRVCLDPCIVDEVKHLWSLGIVTHGCCCGHNEMQSIVNVADENIQQMLDLGYVQNHPDTTRKDTFRLKTAG